MSPGSLADDPSRVIELPYFFYLIQRDQQRVTRFTRNKQTMEKA